MHKDGITVAEYWTELPPKAELEQRLHEALVEARERLARRRVGDVLYGKLRPYLNKVLIADRPGYCTTEIVPVDPGTQLDKRYLFYWLKHPAFLKYVEAESHGMNMPRLGTDTAKAAPFVLAPRNEQTRIADQLDKLLARIQACNDRIDAIPALLKRFRQAVRTDATSGRLTEDWRQSNQRDGVQARLQLNAIRLTQAGKLRVRGEAAHVDKDKLFEIPSTWDWVLNHELAKDEVNAICAGPFGTIFKAKDFREKGVPIIFLRHVGEGCYLTHKPGYMDVDVWRENHQPYSVNGGELLVTKLGDPPGKACIYPEVAGTAMVTPDVLKMDVNGQAADVKYLMHFFNSSNSKRIIEDLCFGVTRLRIDIAMFKTFPIPLPPREEQAEIVRRVDALFSFADRIEARYKAARAQAQCATPLLLAKAFRGELVQQDPRDEPASVLLERIAAAPAKARTSRGRRRVQPERQSVIPELDPIDWASLPDGAWASPADPDGQATMVWLTAVLRAWRGPMLEREARLAALLCQQPRLFSTVLPAAEATQWSRLVGDEARPLSTQVRSFRPAINSHWGRAIKAMRARDDLLEAGLGDGITWALGAGAASIETAGWPDGRAGFVVAYLRAHGMTSVLPMLEPSAQEFVDARAA